MPDINGNELIKAKVFELVDLAKGMHVGDLGCGNLGFFTIPAAKIVGKSGLVYAVDILKPVLQSVDSLVKKEGLENVKTIWSNLEVVGATNIPDNDLDLTMLINMLFLSDKDDMVFKESYRLTKSGGKLIVIDWLSIDTPFGPKQSDRIKKEDARKLAEVAGFSFLEEFVAGPYHFGLIFIK